MGRGLSRRWTPWKVMFFVSLSNFLPTVAILVSLHNQKSSLTSGLHGSIHWIFSPRSHVTRQLIVSHRPVVKLETFLTHVSFFFFARHHPPPIGRSTLFLFATKFYRERERERERERKRERELEAGRINWLRLNVVTLSSFAFDVFILCFCSNFAVMGRGLTEHLLRRWTREKSCFFCLRVMIRECNFFCPLWPIRRGSLTCCLNWSTCSIFSPRSHVTRQVNRLSAPKLSEKHSSSMFPFFFARHPTLHLFIFIWNYINSERKGERERERAWSWMH